MAEFLIKAVDAVHADNLKATTGCYKRGDIVVAAEDGHEWGRLEGLPNFVVVKVTGLSLARAAAFLTPAIDPNEPTRRLRRRRYRIRLDAVPMKILKELRDTGSTTVAWTALRAYVRDEATQQDVTEATEPA